MRHILSLVTASIVLAACAVEPPAEPPQMTKPPAPATSDFLTAYTEQTIPMDRATLRAFMEQTPLIEFLEPTEKISNPVDGTVLTGTWPEEGAARRLELADGHFVIERVLSNTTEAFEYQIFVFTNATGRGVEQIVGQQRFVPTEGGTRFEWTYNVLPTNPLTRLFVQRNMPEIQDYISGGLEGFADATRSAAGS